MLRIEMRKFDKYKLLNLFHISIRKCLSLLYTLYYAVRKREAFDKYTKIEVDSTTFQWLIYKKFSFVLGKCVWFFGSCRQMAVDAINFQDPQ